MQNNLELRKILKITVVEKVKSDFLTCIIVDVAGRFTVNHIPTICILQYLTLQHEM